MINKLNVKRERRCVKSYYILDVAFKCILFLFFLLFLSFLLLFMCSSPIFLSFQVYLGLHACIVPRLSCSSAGFFQVQLSFQTSIGFLLFRHLCNVQQTCVGRLSSSAGCGHLGE